MPTGAHCMPDTGKRMTEAFRRYLQEKYATDADLQRAWGDDAVTRATASVPDQKLRMGSALGDNAVLQHDDLVAAHGHRHALRDDDRGLARHHARKSLLDLSLRRRVQRRGAVVE